MKPITIVLFLMALLMSLPASAQQEQKLLFELSTDQRSYLLGEPIVITATVTNEGDAAVKVISQFDPTFGFSRYKVTPPDGKAAEFVPPWIFSAIAAEQEVAPGRSIHGAVDLYRGAKSSTFDRPGRYEVVGVHNGVGESAPLTIMVNMPEKENVKEAARLMIDAQVTLFLRLEGAESLGGAVERLRQVQKLAPESKLGAYADHALGVHLATPGRDFSPNLQRPQEREQEQVKLRGAKTRPADLERAAKMLDAPVRERLGFHFRTRSYTGMVKGYALAKNFEAAQRTFDAMVKEFGDKPQAATEIKRARSYLNQR